MTITTRDQLIDALGNNSSRLVIDKASISNAAAGQFHSLWRATGQPGQAAIPAAAAVCNNALTGALNFAQQTSPATTYGTWANAMCSNNATTLEIHDRLMHMGGLSGTSTGSQTVNLDINANLASNNLDARKGDANFSDVQWWMEWYTDTGGTAVTATVGVTYNDGTTGTLSVALAATRRASLMIPLNGFIPAAAAGKYIRDIDTVQLSATTGSAGSFGFTATRPRMTMPLSLANKMETFDWAALGLPEIFNSSCLMILQVASTTTTGTVRGGAKLSHG
ncbi:MAG: hypothetical protein KA776_07880 [Pseudoxanthomonas sp.]|nr:hypothetical protein [Pseudoxanthomonas sp.]